jgi:hypothetical protein
VDLLCTGPRFFGGVKSFRFFFFSVRKDIRRSTFISGVRGVLKTHHHYMFCPRQKNNFQDFQNQRCIGIFVPKRERGEERERERERAREREREQERVRE